MAEALLVLAGLERLVPVLEQIAENGANRLESIGELAARDRNGKEEAKRRYSRNLEKS